VAVVQSDKFVHGLRATEFVLFFVMSIMDLLRKALPLVPVAQTVHNSAHLHPKFSEVDGRIFQRDSYYEE
jgi:hypothetical protein